MCCTAPLMPTVMYRSGATVEPGQADLQRRRHPAGVGHRARGADRGAEHLRQLLDVLPVLGTAQSATARDDDLGVLEPRPSGRLLADLLEHLDRVVRRRHVAAPRPAPRRPSATASVSNARGRSVATFGVELMLNSAMALPPKTGLVMTSSPPSTRSAVASVTMPVSSRYASDGAQLATDRRRGSAG